MSDMEDEDHRSDVVEDGQDDVHEEDDALMTTTTSKKRKLSTVVTSTSSSTTALIAPAVIIKTKTGEFDWHICITQSGTFRRLVGIVSKVLTALNCRLKSTNDGSDDFSGILIDAVDNACVCMIKARFECTISGANYPGGPNINDQTFCVDAQAFEKLLTSVESKHQLELYCARGSANISGVITDPDAPNDPISFELSTRIDDSERITMDNLHSTYGMDISLSHLKSICNLAVDPVGAEYMCITIEAPACGLVNGVQHSFITLSAKGDTSVTRRRFHSMSSPQSDSSSTTTTTTTATTTSANTTCSSVLATTTTPAIHIKTSSPDSAQTDVGPLTTLYSDEFPVKYLISVLKKMDRGTVNLGLCKDTPMIMRYALGDEQSHIRVILAPKAK